MQTTIHTFLRPAMFLVIGLLVSSCTATQLVRAVVPTATQEDRAEAERLMATFCEAEAGTVIHETVQDVEGFLILPNATYGNGRDKPATDQASGGCGVDCLRYFVLGYAFVEADVTTYPRVGRPIGDFETSTGRYRYELRPRSEQTCKQHDLIHKNHSFMQRMLREHPEVFAGQCVVPTQVTEFRSEYGYQIRFIDKPFRLADNLVANRRGSRVVDLATGNDIALTTRFSVHKPGVGNHLVGRCGPDTSLPVADVLIPAS